MSLASRLFGHAIPRKMGDLSELAALAVVDAKGQIAWSVDETLPVYSGVLATAGGVVFYGTLDKQLKAVDASTGKALFSKALECGVIGNPITYMGPDGHQRVAVYTGVGWLAGGFAGGTCSGTAAHGAGAGGVLHVFKLP